MADLIARLRLLVGDGSTADPRWSDDRLQEALDRHRERWLQRPLTAEPDLSGDYLVFSADGLGNWEGSDFQLGYTITTADEVALDSGVFASADLASGVWTFNATQNPSLFLTGYSYDLYGTAAEVLAWALAEAKDDVDFSADGVSVSPSKRSNAILDLIKQYEGQATGGGPAPGTSTIGTARMRRSDLNEASGW
jgi:hypothetical protein